MRPCWSMGFQNWISKDSWLIVHKPIKMLSKLFMVLKSLLLGWSIMNAPIYSIGLSRSISTPKNWSNLSYKINTTLCATNTRMQNPLWRLMVSTLQFVISGCHQVLLRRQVSMSFQIGLTFGILVSIMGRFHGPREHFTYKLPMIPSLFYLLKIGIPFALEFHFHSASICASILLWHFLFC
jgi:hypothetical protein